MRILVLLVLLLGLGAGLYFLVRSPSEEGGSAAGLPHIGASPRERAEERIELGEAYEQLEKLTEAEKAYREAGEADSTFGLPFLRQGALMLVRGEMDSARLFIEKAVRLAPEESDAHFHMGFIHEEAGDTAAAEAEYQNAVRLDSTNAEAYNNLGYLLTKQGRVEEAIPVLEAGRFRDSESPFLAKNLGRAYGMVSRWEDAKPLLEQSQSLAARDPELLLDFACLSRALGNDARAQAILRQYVLGVADSTKREAAIARFESVTP